MSGYVETPKSMDASGNIVNPATQDTLAQVKTKTDNLDVALSTRATEATLGQVKADVDRLDVNLSTRASETTLAAIKAQTDKLTFTGNNLDVTSGSVIEYFFSRILNENFHDTEQMKRDAPSASYQNAFEYIGLAPAAAVDTDATWAIVRKEYNATGDLIAQRVRLNIQWAQRTAGW